MTDRFVIRWPHEGHKDPTWPQSNDAWLEDTRDGSLFFSDGGEPEDAILCRDLKVFVDAMNKADADLVTEKTRADDLSRTVAAMAGALADIADSEDEHGKPSTADWMSERARAILSRPDVTAERGRWVSREFFERHRKEWEERRDVVLVNAEAIRDEERDARHEAFVAKEDARNARADRDALSSMLVGAIAHADAETDRAIAAERERDAAIARAEVSDAAARALGDDFTRVLRECADLKARADEKEVEAHFNARACEDNQRLITAAERARDELGIQLRACQERLRLAMAVVDAARALPTYRANMSDLAVVRGKIAALDAVPGDARALRHRQATPRQRLPTRSDLRGAHHARH